MFLWLIYNGFKVYFPIPAKLMLSAGETLWPKIKFLKQSRLSGPAGSA